MDLITWNKIAGAVLGAAMFVVAARIGAEALFEAQPPEHPAYIVEGLEDVEAPTEPVVSPDLAPPDFASAIPAASIGNGQIIAAPCAVCHNWEDGGGNMIGPNLFAIVGSEKANVDGFNYSPAFQGLGGEWTFAELFAFLEQPAVFAPGTTMAFAGLPREQDRLDLIAYMRSWSASPAPLPMPIADPTIGDAPAP